VSREETDTKLLGRAVVREVSRRPHTAEARFRFRGRVCCFVVDQVTLGHAALEVFHLPLPVSFHECLKITFTLLPYQKEK